MINEKSIQVLELPKILNQLAKHTSFSASADLARDLLPSTRLDEAQIWQRETAEARDMFANGQTPSMGGARDVRDVAINATRGVMIDAHILVDIRFTLRRATTLRRTLGRQKGPYPLLAEIIAEAEECNDLQDAIAGALDDNAEVKDSASPKLAIIRRDLKVAFDRLQSKLNRIVTSGRNAQFLQEAIVTQRSGRYVIPIKSEFKGRIPGVVHDSSSSGATLFIEPLDTVELNNKWRELQIDEEKEIRRILLALSEMVGNESEAIVRTVEVLAYLDLVFARAHYADDMAAVQPVLVPFDAKPSNPDHPGSVISITAARHPLLKGHVVPIDIDYDNDTWALVVTGPNTGGKTVALKTLGLLVLMAQCGLHIPADEGRMCVFEGVFADIGDEQSIEQSLSTFSSHMTNTISILREADSRSLVLLDELGAGTDPAEGSALARAILSYMVERKVTLMVTTHHPELKTYSVETPGVRNASVEFDLDTLAPTYRLIIGLPGRSNALSIATRLGLDSEIIERARTMVATEDLVADDLLDEIHRTREAIRRQYEEAERMREEVQAERDELRARLDNIEDERRDVVNAARRNAQGEIADFQREIKKLRDEMRVASMPLENLRAVQEAAQKLMEYADQPVFREVDEIPSDDDDWRPKLGDTVWVEKLNAEGTVTELEDTEAVVQVGTLRVRAGYDEMRKRTKSERRAKARGRRQFEPSNEVSLPKTESPGLELDLRGRRVDEAIRMLEDYIDAAYRSGLPYARIIHGKGTGALRRAVRDHVAHHPLISKVEEARGNEGGEGVTVLHMVPLH